MKSPVGDADEQSGYGSALGYTRLRERLASLHQTQGLKVTSSQILMTFGANHALDLITRYFLTPGCTVLVDEPGYYPLFAKLKLARVNIEGVRRTPQGPDLNELEQKARDLKPVMFFTQSRGQNPTGSSMDLPTAHEVLRLADRHSMLVVDDDPFLHLPDVDGTPLSLLDQFRNTICIGTFAKTLSASLRAGYIMAREDIIAPLTELKMITSVNSSRHSEMLIYNFLERGEYHRHLKRLQNRINEAARAVISGTEKAGYELFCPPTGGYYTYLTLPDGMNDLEVAKRGAAEGIFIAPGSLFSSNMLAQPAGLRINVARAADARFFRFLSALRDGQGADQPTSANTNGPDSRF
nr:PLP-dependent aminotransferase family protein [Sneathiella chinensis]